MNYKRSAFPIIFCTLVLLNIVACTKNKTDDAIEVFSSSGDISQKLSEFRNRVGSMLNTAPGATSGRREIDWDGIPSDLLNKSLPGDFFNPTAAEAPAGRKRGLLYSAAGGEFIASNNGFAETNAQAANQFTSFSGANAFANVSSSLWDAEFRVPGSAEIATVKGFGIVFVDVDKENNAFIEYFNGQKSLGKFYAPSKTNNSNFSFVGVYFKDEVVTRVRISHEGTISTGDKDISNGGSKDLVAFDDFIYSEPIKK